MLKRNLLKIIILTTIIINSSISVFANTIMVDLNDLRVPSGASKEQLESLMMPEMKGWGEYFKEAEEIYNINAIVYIALVRLESGNGTNTLTKNKNNCTSYNMAKGGQSFGTIRDCIMTTAESLQRNYLTKGGKYFNGYSLSAVNVKYCVLSDWNDKILEIIEKM